MNDLSMYILDIAQNSIKACAKNLLIELYEDIDNQLIIVFKDDGKGINNESLELVLSPFYTTRTTRRVGLGLPFLKMICEMCEGDLEIQSTVNVGTVVRASLKYDHIDRPDLGDIVETIYTLCINPKEVNIVYKHYYKSQKFVFDTNEIKEILNGVPFENYEVMKFIKIYLRENINNIKEEKQ